MPPTAEPDDHANRTAAHTPQHDSNETGPAQETGDAGSTPRPSGTHPNAGGRTAPTVPGYDILGELGRGGMGIVYHARQTGLNRAVALKMLLREGPAEGGELIRFLAEAEAIAAVRHTNVVQVYEYGERDGRPFLALEFCPGGTLAARLKAASRRKGSAARSPFPAYDAAELVRKLADGVAAAHDQGIVHRDLKPGNVLFDAAGEPKVSDFGLAKHGHGQADLTRTQAVMGTPAYMSPEQAKGASKFVGPAADVWALGVILYECLTGQRPFQHEDALVLMARIRTEEPTSLRSLNSSLPRDLELICRKCLEKEPHERYPSAKELADDLGRFLNGEPVHARPAGAGQRFVKWARRNPGYAALWSGLALTLVVGAGISAVFAARAERARAAESARAETERQARLEAAAAVDAERVANQAAAARLTQVEKAYNVLAAIFKDLNLKHVGEDDQPLSVTLRERVELAAKELDAIAIDDPLTVAGLQTDLAESLVTLGAPDRAAELAEKALAIRQARLGPDNQDTLRSQATLALAHLTADRLEQATTLLQDTLARRTTVLGADHRDTIITSANLGSAYVHSGKYSRAVLLLEETWERSRARFGSDDRVTLNILNNLAVAHEKAGTPARAVALCEEALNGLKATLPENHPILLGVQSNLATAYLYVNRPDRSIPLFERGLRQQTQTLGQDHPSTLTTRANLAAARRAIGQMDQAIEILEEVVPLLQTKLGKTHGTTLSALSELGAAYKFSGRPKLAVPVHEEALAGWRARRGPDHPDALIAMSNLAGAHFMNGNLDKATELFERVFAERVKQLGWSHAATVNAASNTAHMYEQAGRWTDAARVYADHLAAVRQEALPGTPKLVGPLVFLGNAQLMAQQHAEAEVSLREALAICEDVAPQQWGTFRAKSLLGAALLGQGKTAEAGPLILEGYKGVAERANFIPQQVRRERLGEVLRPVVRYYEVTGKPDEARRWQAELDKLFPAVAPPPREVMRP